MSRSGSGEPGGKIVTFYSYKGGTGRSMALANVAWILASAGKRVLAVDWDLEAPGLHRYFYPFLADRRLTETDGLIDFFVDLAVAAATPAEADKRDEDWYREQANVLRYAVSLDWTFPADGFIDFIPAGRQSAAYSTRVNSFNWQRFYERLGGGEFVEAFKKQARAEYDYVLIDSRTGVSDTSGICTVQLPDILVVCFTLNNQSIDGASAVARSVYEQRSEARAAEIRILPIAMRTDDAEKDKLDRRVEYAARVFAPFVRKLPRRVRDAYWSETPFKYVPYYGYEEILAVFGDRPERPTPLLTATQRLTALITLDTVRRIRPIPETSRLHTLAQYAAVSPDTDAPTDVPDSTTSEPRTWLIGPNADDDYPTIAQAIEVAEPNERLLVRAGLYDRVVVDKPLEIVGEGMRGEVVIQANAHYAVRLDAPSGRLVNLTIQLTGGEGCPVEIIQGRPELEFCDINGGSRGAVIINAQADPTLRGNRIRGSAGTGLIIANAGAGTFEDNDIAGNAAVGVVIGPGAVPTLRLNRVLDNGQSGVLFDKESRGTLENNEIAGNHLAGVEINFGAAPDVRENQIHHNSAIGVSVFDGGRGTIQRNRIYSNGTAGVAIGAADEVIVRSNQISNNAGVGILVVSGGKPQIQDNEISFNRAAGVELAPDTQPRLAGNRIERNDHGEASSSATRVQLPDIEPARETSSS
jgi:parallel beta-helix repeat protein